MNRLTPLLIILGLIVIPVHAANFKQVRPHHIFWETAPAPTPDTLLLWNFGEDEGEATLEELDEEALLDEDDEDGETNLGELVSTESSKIPPALTGKTTEVEKGRFGKALALSAGATAGTKEVALHGATLDLWVRLTSITETPLLKAKHGPLLLQLMKDGRVKVTLGKEDLLTHPRPLRAKAWTHLALAVTAKSITLCVDGHPHSAIPPRRRGGKPKPPRNGFSIGGKGFAGDIDEVHLRKREQLFYPLEAPIDDPEKTRALTHTPPHFIRALRPHVSLSFDKGLKPEVQKSGTAEGKSVKKLLVPGLRGKALDLSLIDKTGFALRGYSALPKKAGTLSVWLRPKDWNNFFKGGHLGEGVKSLNLFRQNLPKGGKAFAARQMNVRMGYPGSVPSNMVTPIHPGTWTHILITWGGKKGRVYINGKPQLSGQTGLRRPSEAHSKTLKAWLKRTGGKDNGEYTIRFSP
ncbi:MAG: LamG-like jellyroll fold domain-containing protein, partial [Planctomycetota bacterium]